MVWSPSAPRPVPERACPQTPAVSQPRVPSACKLVKYSSNQICRKCAALLITCFAIQTSACKYAALLKISFAPQLLGQAWSLNDGPNLELQQLSIRLHCKISVLRNEGHANTIRKYIRTQNQRLGLPPPTRPHASCSAACQPGGPIGAFHGRTAALPVWARQTRSQASNARLRRRGSGSARLGDLPACQANLQLPVLQADE